MEGVGSCSLRFVFHRSGEADQCFTKPELPFYEGVALQPFPFFLLERLLRN